MDNNVTNIIAQESDEIIRQDSNDDFLTAIYGDFDTGAVHSLSAERGREPPMKVVTAPRSDSPRVDGPCHPYSWRLDGKTIGKMRTGSWKMVTHLWQQLDRAATYGDLLQPVYDDPEHVA